MLFALKQVVEAYDFHQQQIASCDTELPQYLAKLPSRTPVGEARPAVQVEKPAKQRKKLKASRKSKDNRPHFDLGAELERLMGVHLRIIDGIDLMTVQVIHAELGPDLSAWPAEAHFASWLELSPRRDVSGGKAIKQEKRPVKNRSYLGARHRLLRARLGRGSKRSRRWPAIWLA